MSEGNEISRSYEGPSDGKPLIPEWALKPLEQGEILVEQFLNDNAWWFDDPGNGLCGKREECRQALLAYLKTGEMPRSLAPGGYVVMMFRREVEGIES